MIRTAALALVLSATLTGTTVAQTPPPAGPPPVAPSVAAPAPATSPPKPKAGPDGTPTAPQRTLVQKPASAPGQPTCTRLPLSDIQFTREKTVDVARMRLDEYAQKVAKTRGWKGFRKSDEVIACDVYLYLGPLGTEYKCLVTATFCPAAAPISAAAQPASSTATVQPKPAVVGASSAAPAPAVAKPPVAAPAVVSPPAKAAP
jgi:hypothetical protein